MMGGSCNRWQVGDATDDGWGLQPTTGEQQTGEQQTGEQQKNGWELQQTMSGSCNRRLVGAAAGDDDCSQALDFANGFQIAKDHKLKYKL